MTSLTTLPDSIIQSIFDYLSITNVLNLSYVSRKFNKTAVRILYHDVRLSPPRKRPFARKLALLLRTLLERPNFAAYITSVKIPGDYQIWVEQQGYRIDHAFPNSNWAWAFDDCGSILCTAQMVKASKILNRFVDNEEHNSQEKLWRRSKDTLAVAILTRCKSIQTLEVEEGFLRHSHLLPEIFRHMDRIFPKLHNIILGDRQVTKARSIPYVDLSLIRPMFQSSSVQSVQCTMTEPWQLWNTPTPPRNLALTSLHLTRSNITRSTLALLLSATPNLRIFHYEQLINFDESLLESPPLEPYLELDSINTALLQLRHTLEECQLIIRLSPGSFSPSQCAASNNYFSPVDGRLCLRDFPRLKKVEVPLIMLFGWYPKFSTRLEEILPSGISNLTLRDDLVLYCPWSTRPSACERRALRIGKYIRDRTKVAPGLSTVNVRLTSAKETLRPALEVLRDLEGAMEAEMSVIRGTKSETYAWKFQETKSIDARPRLVERVDSVINLIAKPETPSDSQDKIVENSVSIPSSIFSFSPIEFNFPP